MWLWNSLSCSDDALDVATTFIKSFSRGLDAARAASIWITGSPVPAGRFEVLAGLSIGVGVRLS